MSLPAQDPMAFAAQIPDEVVSSEIFKFKLKINGIDVQFDLFHDSQIVYENLIQVLQDTPQQFVYWAAMYTEAKEMAGKIENAIRVRKAVLTESLIANFQQAGTKPTDTQTKMLIDGDDQLSKMQLALIKLTKIVSKLYYMAETVKMMSENARSLSGFAKAERNRA